MEISVRHNNIFFSVWPTAAGSESFYSSHFSSRFQVALADLQMTKQPLEWHTWHVRSGACFGNFFETPFGAIPYYLITGLAIAPLQAKAEQAYVSSRFKNYSHQQAHVYGLELFHGATGRSAP